MIELRRRNPLSWKKSTASVDSNCLEVAVDGPITFLRDSKDPSGSVLIFPGAEWAKFLLSTRADQFGALSSPTASSHCVGQAGPASR